MAQTEGGSGGLRSPLRYFSLIHHAPDAVDPSDAAILSRRHRDISEEAAFYGYDLSSGNWKWDQALCPQLPGTILLHYSSAQPNGRESLFTVLVPRDGGRIRIVPVYYHNATPWHAAVKRDRNFDVFNSLVPAETAKKSADPEGDWLSLAACYVEMVGGEPNIPNEPSLVPETLLAPQPTIEVSVSDRTRHILFTDRDADNQYIIWSVVLSGEGKVIAAQSQTYAAYVAKISNPPAPVATMRHPKPVPH
ncbi:hypothetical protein [Paracidobacterium acidisoli]|uniref:hypothetical protein n=1 Tax=Paracidobacterium acidisoli TaxID=2303751 RepID=UPI0011C14E18|nr:hypothetical protein [Paracidobacterium acidisoli]MBT9329849.1 hypothetical protein [Paracidobacterium acidisoli]